MTPKKPKPPTHIRDARSKRVTQLDPVEMRLLRKHDVIDQKTLRTMSDEIGSGLEARTRRFMPLLIVGVCGIAVILIVQIIDYAINRDVSAIISPRNIALANIWFFILVIWTRARQARFGRIRKVMLAHHRCPHCGYELRGLPADDSDGATLCPECGCAWKINTRTGAEDDGDD